MDVPIGLIEHDVLDETEVQVGLLGQMQQASWRRDDAATRERKRENPSE